MLLLAGYAAIGGFDGSAKAATSQSPGGSGGLSQDPAAIATATSAVPADPAKASKLLQASTQHYADLLAQGQKIVGHTRYADPKAYGQAFTDPKSPAALFAAYRTKPNPEADSSYSDAFTKAGAAFGTATRPAALEKWSSAMVKAKNDLSAWVTLAVQYQSSTASQPDLGAAAALVTGDLATAKADAVAAGG